MDLDEATLAMLLTEVQQHLLSRFAGHPCWDDLLGEARLGAWIALQKLAPASRCPVVVVARKAGMWAALAWLRSKKNDQRTRTRKGKPLPERVFFEPGVREPSGGEFVTGVLERLAREEWQEWLDKDPARAWLKAQLLARIVVGGERVNVVARELGIPLRSCYTLRREALATLRAEEEG